MHAPPLPVTATALPWTSYVEILRSHAEHTPTALALVAIPQLTDITQSLNWNQLDQRVRALAGHLQRLGAKAERALLVLDNDPEYVIAFLACAYAGCVAVTLHVPMHKRHLDRLEQVANDADARFILSTTPSHQRFYKDLQESPSMQKVQWVLLDTITDHPDDWDDFYPQPSDIAFLQYTSGSTGTPRGVMVSHENLMYQGAYMETLFSITRKERILSWLPLFHDMGLILGLLQGIFCGVPVFLAHPSAFVKHPDRWLRSISTHRITFSGAPDFAFDLCAENVDPDNLKGIDLSCWSQAFNAAEPVRARTIERFFSAFSPLGFQLSSFIPSYGLAEATLAVTVTPRGRGPCLRAVDPQALSEGFIRAPQTQSRTLVASGRCVPDTFVYIVDPNNETILPHETIGEVWVGGTGPALGYWQRPDDSVAVFQQRLVGKEGTFLRTGDLGFLDAEGNLTLTGRLKDLIIIAGRNHYPQDLELTTEASHPALRPHLSAAFAVDEDAQESVVIMAEIRREAEGALDIHAIGQTIAHRIAVHHDIPVKEVVLIYAGQLPRTTSGKVQRRRARELWQADALQIHGRFSVKECL